MHILSENIDGKIGSNFGYSKLEETKQASTYADAAKGLLMSFLGAGVMYGITAVLVRLAGQEGIDPIAVMFIRSLFQVSHPIAMRRELAIQQHFHTERFKDL